MNRQFKWGVVATAGYLLSPLSWWNDVFVNIPIAYVLAMPFSLANERLFVPALIFSYWLTNLAGLLLLRTGLSHLADRGKARHSRREVILASLLYTLILACLAATGVLKAPWNYFRQE